VSAYFYFIKHSLFLQYNTVKSNSLLSVNLIPPPYIESAHRSANLCIPEILGYNTGVRCVGCVCEQQTGNDTNTLTSRVCVCGVSENGFSTVVRKSAKS
jgi:hypothetical protein